MTGSHFTWFNAANVAGSEWGFICLPAGLPPPLQPPQHCRHACRRRSSTVAMLAAAAAALSPCLSARRPTCSCHPARVHPEHPYPDLLSHWPGRHPARLPPLSPPMRFALPSSLLLQPLSTWSTSCLASTPDSSSLATSSRRWSWRCALHWLCCAVLCCAVLCCAVLSWPTLQPLKLAVASPLCQQAAPCRLLTPNTCLLACLPALHHPLCAAGHPYRAPRLPTITSGMAASFWMWWQVSSVVGEAASQPGSQRLLLLLAAAGMPHPQERGLAGLAWLAGWVVQRPHSLGAVPGCA